MPNSIDYATGRFPRGRGDQFRPLPGFADNGKKPKEGVDFFPPHTAEMIPQAILSGLGVALTITRDGGALSLTVYDGDDVYRSYASYPDEIDALWVGLGTLINQKMGVPTVGPQKHRRNGS
jgi:hypothetical protein